MVAPESLVEGCTTPVLTTNETNPALYFDGNNTYMVGWGFNKSGSDDGITGTYYGERIQFGIRSHKFIILDSQIEDRNTICSEQDMDAPMHLMQEYATSKLAYSVREANVQKDQPEDSLASSLKYRYGASSWQAEDYFLAPSLVQHGVPSNACSLLYSLVPMPSDRQESTTAWRQPAPNSSAHIKPGDVTGRNTGHCQGMRSPQPGNDSPSVDVEPKTFASSPSWSLHRHRIQQKPHRSSGNLKAFCRTAQKEVEKKYRNNLKDCFAKLCAVVPALQDGEVPGNTTDHANLKFSKGTVLSKATEYIQQLEQANRVMTSKSQNMLNRLQALEKLLHSQQELQYRSN